MTKTSQSASEQLDSYCTLTMLWRNLSSIRRQTHKKLLINTFCSSYRTLNLWRVRVQRFAQFKSWKRLTVLSYLNAANSVYHLELYLTLQKLIRRRSMRREDILYFFFILNVVSKLNERWLCLTLSLNRFRSAREERAKCSGTLCIVILFIGNFIMRLVKRAVVSKVPLAKAF